MSVFLSIAIFLVVLYVFLKRKSKKSGSLSVERQQKDTRRNVNFHAVSLKFSAYACKAAKDMQGKRFLSNDAPRLPLPECDSPECKCKFIHYKDRRALEPRRSPYQQNMGVRRLEEEEKRKRRDRRKNSN